MERFNALLKKKCPNCHQGDIYKNNTLFWFGKIHDNCEHCGHKYEKEPGFFMGAMYVSYGLAIAECVGIYIIAQFFFDTFFDTGMVFILLATIVFMSGFNYTFSRVIWMYMFTPKGKSLTKYSDLKGN